MSPILFAESIREMRSNPRLSVISKRKLRRHFFPLVAVVCFTLSLLFMTFVQVGVFIEGYSIAQLEHQQDELLSNLQAFKLEEAVLKRPERIRRIAMQELQLIQPSKVPVIRLP